jgi:uncharacterized DUF497 family protein
MVEDPYPRGGRSMTSFEWDVIKDKLNRAKHGVGFEEAQLAFLDSSRVIAEVLSHSQTEQRYFCFGKVGRNSHGSVLHGVAFRSGFSCGLLAERKAIYEEING